MSDLDGNTWYQITESRVDFNSSLQYGNGGLFFAAAGSNIAGQYWQIFALDGGNFQFRNKASNILKQMGLLYRNFDQGPS